MTQYTSPSDVQIPEVMMDIMRAQEATFSTFLTSGVAQQTTYTGIKEEGTSIKQPRWTMGDDGNIGGIADNNEIAPDSISSYNVEHPIIWYTKRFDTLWISDVVGKGSASEEARRQLAVKSAKQFDTACVRTLEGVAGALTDNQYDYSGTGTISAAAIITAKGKLLDNRGVLSAAPIIARSKVADDLLALSVVAADSLTTGGDSANQMMATGAIQKFQGHPVIISEKLYRESGADTGDYYTYIVAPGTILWDNQVDFSVFDTFSVERLKNIVASTWRRAIGVLDVGYSGSFTSQGPTETNLRTAASWTVTNLASQKLCPIVRLQTT